MAKCKTDPSKMLNEVVIKATPLTKPSTKTALYPKGEASNKQIDSLKNTSPQMKKLIGEPIKKAGYRPQYGTNQSDIIKQALKPKPKPPLPKGNLLAKK